VNKVTKNATQLEVVLRS